MTFRFPIGGRLVVALAELSLLLVCGAYASRDSQIEWNGIVPLQSTRSDVEKRFGNPSAECHCAYSTANEAIVVNYAAGHCKGPPYGWNVGADTVLEIKLFPKQQMVVSEGELLTQNFIKSREIDGPTVYYTNVLRGIKYAVSDGKVNSVSYIPSSKDVTLRCPGFPPYDGGLREYHPYAAFSSKAQFISERLAQFGAQLSHSTGVKGYIISYAGQLTKEGEARRMAERAKRLVTQGHRVLAARITAIDGGFREIAEYELFLIPNDMPPPAPTPTVASNQVRIVGKYKKKLKSSG